MTRRESVWQAGEVRLSGIEAVPAGTAVATIVALHGGGYSAGYWDHPLDRSASLLEVGASLGYRVVAVDRPGYGASHGLTGPDVRLKRQAEVVLDLIEALRSEPGSGPAVFLIGHSVGAILALFIAASHRADMVAAVEISGLPFFFHRSRVDRSQLEGTGYSPGVPRERRLKVFYGPAETYDPEILVAEARLFRPIPAGETLDAYECPETTPVLAKDVTVPIQITRAEFEKSSGGGRKGLTQCGRLFTSSPRVFLHWQRGSGHNISLHRVARAYHLRAIAFFDEVLASGGMGGDGSVTST